MQRVPGGFARAAEAAGTAPLPGSRVVAVANGRGGVGRTTLAHNLAVYLRTVDASLPVLVLGLDDRTGPEDMFALDPVPPAEAADTALRRGCFDHAIRPGRYGVHYVASSPRIGALARGASDPFPLREALRRTAFPGLVLIDTPGDLGALTRSAIAASDLCVVPVADLASLHTAGRIFELLAAWGRPRTRARVLLSMVDLRIKYPDALCGDVLGLLVASTRRLGLPLFQAFVARSPRVQALATNPEGRTLSILNDATRTSAHHQLGELAEELYEALERLRPSARRERTGDAAASPHERGEGPFAWLRPRTRQAALALGADRQSLCIRDFPFFLGRQDPGVLNDLAIPDPRPWQVSRRHAHFVRREGRIGVADLGSTLGTWVAGHQLGGPTADPGPVFFGPRGGELVLGRRDSPYAFDVAVGRTAAALPARESPSPAALRAGALAALVS